jgi:hypothetical protein
MTQLQSTTTEQAGIDVPDGLPAIRLLSIHKATGQGAEGVDARSSVTQPQFIAAIERCERFDASCVAHAREPRSASRPNRAAGAPTRPSYPMGARLNGLKIDQDIAVLSPLRRSGGLSENYFEGVISPLLLLLAVGPPLLAAGRPQARCIFVNDAEIRSRAVFWTMIGRFCGNQRSEY